MSNRPRRHRRIKRPPVSPFVRHLEPDLILFEWFGPGECPFCAAGVPLGSEHPPHGATERSESEDHPQTATATPARAAAADQTPVAEVPGHDCP